MSKIIFTISYEINPEKREEYLTLSRQMKEHLSGASGRNYAIYEQKGKKNSFTEIFICANKDEYDQIEDQDDTTSQLVQKLETFLANGKMKYTTLVELP
jgi:L-rhamnose mutarotase